MLIQRRAQRTVAAPATRATTGQPLDRPRLTELARHGFSSLVASGLVQVINVVTGVMIARGLGPAGRGQLAAALLWPTALIAIGSLGVIEAVPYFTSRWPEKATEIASTGMLLAALESAAVMAGGYFLMPLVLGHYGSEVVYDGRLYLLSAPLTLLTLVGAEVLRGRLAISAYNLVRVFVVFWTLIGLLPLLAAHRFTVPSILAVYLSANLLTLTLTLVLLYGYGVRGFRARPRLVSGMLGYGVKSHAGNISRLANLRTDQTLISLFFAPVSLGLYSVAVTVNSPVNLIGISIGLVALPAISRCQSPADMKMYFGRFVQIVLALSGLAVLGLALVAPMLITLFFGPAFAPASWPARLLLLGGLFMSVNHVLAASLNAFNKPLVPSLALMLATGVTIIALAGLLPRLGIVGAAAASVLSSSTATACMSWYAIRRLRVPLRHLLPNGSDVAWLWSRLGRRDPAGLVP